MPNTNFMNRFLQIGLLLFLGFAYGQKVEFLVKGDSLQKPEYQVFVYVDDKTDLSNSVFVGKVKSSGKLDDVSQLFNSIKSEAIKVGATSFRFESFTRTADDFGELVLSVYFNQGDFFDVNFGNLPKDTIFIFGSPDLTANKKQSYKVDGNKHEIASGTFKRFDIPTGKEVRISKGGFTGMTLWVGRKEGGYSSFLGFSGIGVNQIGVSPTGGGGISINTGTIHKLEPNLALALSRIYQEAE